MRDFLKGAIRVSLPVIVVCLLALVLIDPLATWFGMASPLARATAAVLAVGLAALWVFLVLRWGYSGERPEDHSPTQYSPGQILELLQTPIDDKDVEAYAALIAKLCGRAVHVHESYSIEANSMHRVIEAHYELSSDIEKVLAEGPCIFPAMTVAKGFLPENLVVHQSYLDSHLPILPYRKVLTMQLKTLSVLFYEFFEKDDNTNALFTEACAAIAFLGSRSRSAATPPVSRLIELIEKQHQSNVSVKPTTVNISKLTSFIRVYSHAYPLCVEIRIEPSASGHLSLQLAQRTQVFEAVDGPRDTLRMVLGLSPYKFRIPLMLYLLSESYHLSVEGSPDWYLHSQSLQRQVVMATGEGKSASPASLEWRSVTPRDLMAQNDGSYVRTRIDSDSGFAHVHLRGFRKALTNETMFLLVRFHERLPGVLGIVTGLMALLTISLYFLGFMCSQPSPGEPVDVVALLVALPALAAGVAGRNVSISSRTSSLTSRVALVAVAVLAGSGVILYAAQKLNVFRFPGATFSVLGVPMGLADWAWVWLVGISMFVSGYLAVTYWLRASAYYRNMRRTGRHGAAERLTPDPTETLSAPAASVSTVRPAADSQAAGEDRVAQEGQDTKGQA